MIQYDHIVKLAELQASVEGEKDKANKASEALDEGIKYLRKLRDDVLRPHVEMIEELQTTIESLKHQIVIDWDGEKKTIPYEFGTLRLTTRKKLEVHNDPAMMVDLISHIEPERIIDYVKGFEVKKLTEYMGTFPQPPEVAEIVETTTASFKNK